MHPVITATDMTQIPAPTGIALTGVTPTAQFGNLNGGVAFPDACPAGQAVIGYHGFVATQGWHGQIQALCGTLTLGAGVTPTVTLDAGETLPLRGVFGVVEWTRTCGSDEVVVGFAGRSGALIDQLTFVCAPSRSPAGPGLRHHRRTNKPDRSGWRNGWQRLRADPVPGRGHRHREQHPRG
jgi:hypothetical protein